jgi:hypothetical protein
MFKRAKTVEIISHPYVLNDNIVNQLLEDTNKKLTNKKNKHLLKDLPRNSIIAQLIDTNERIIAIPFFSSHISLPLKSGEDVWIYKEDRASSEGEEKSVEYFWMSRIHGMNFYEDVNFTHEDRKYLKRYEDKTELSSSTELFVLENDVKEKTPIAQFNDGPVYNTPTGKLSNPNTRQNVNNLKLNLAGTHIIEDVPRYSKNPGDLVIQGSNNTLIRLGTNSAYESNQSSYNASRPLSYNDYSKYSGTIDIVAGRAAISKEQLTSNELVDYHLNKESVFYRAISKRASRNGMLVVFNEKNSLENLKDTDYYLRTNAQNLAEGDTDFYTDVSRLYVSEYCAGDTLLNYSGINSIENSPTGFKSPSERKDFRGFIIAKSDEIRLVARGNIFNINRSSDNLFSVNENFQETGGSIKIIKEGNSTNLAYLSLEHDGIVSLNGSKIVIGDENKTKENGKSEQVYIGHGAKEPLVLGYFLKNKLENFMNEVCRSLVLINKNLDEINNKFNEHVSEYNVHFHTSTAPTTPTTPVVTQSVIQITSTNIPDKLNNDGIDNPSLNNENGEYGLIKDMKEVPANISESIQNIILIKNSLTEMLSTLGKTL